MGMYLLSIMLLHCVALLLLLDKVAAWNNHNQFIPMNYIQHPVQAYDAPLHNQRRIHLNFPAHNTRWEGPEWAEFWDAYNYKGPLEEEAVPFQHWEVPYIEGGARPLDTSPPRNDQYDKYREYFFRRFGYKTK